MIAIGFSLIISIPRSKTRPLETLTSMILGLYPKSLSLLIASTLVSTNIAVISILPFEFNFSSTRSRIFSSCLPLPPTMAMSISSISFMTFAPSSLINVTLSPSPNLSRFLLVVSIASGFVSIDIT